MILLLTVKEYKNIGINPIRGRKSACPHMRSCKSRMIGGSPVKKLLWLFENLQEFTRKYWKLMSLN